MSMAPYGDRPDRGPWPTALRRVLAAAARVGNRLRAALIRVARRFAQEGEEGILATNRTKICSAQVREDEYRAGFAFPTPHAAGDASDLHECPWCLSLGNPGIDDPADPDGPGW